MTSRGDGLWILGPLEARLDGDAIPLGGAKQCAALALLLLNANESVSLNRLIDELWGDDPPPSAAHSLEAYVSRLRQLLSGLGVQVLRRGVGYVLLLGDARLDAVTFAQLHDAADEAAAAGDDGRARELAAAALALWRGSALVDVRLGPSASVEAERLEERRLLVFEHWAGAELRVGHHDNLIGELQALVRRNPYRERLVALLMLALYRSGRSADALGTYERARARLAEDLGLQPGEELQQLSGRIVRHDPSLRLVAASAGPVAPERSRRRARMFSAIAASFAAVALLLAAGGSVRQVADAAPPRAGVRVALVLPRPPAAGTADAIATYESRVRDYLYFDKRLSFQTVIAADVADATPALARGGFDLVLWVGDGPVARAFSPRVRDLPATRFVFLEASLETLALQGVPNAAAVRFADEESSELVGYMSGFVNARGAAARADAISVIAQGPTRATRRAVAGFRRGVARANPDVAVLIGYVGEGADPTRCEQLANAQIDRGSDVVFIAAGRCGAGASAVARIRNVWAVDGDGALDDGEHLLVRAYKERHRAVDAALTGFDKGTLPSGGDLVLGLADDYAVGISATSTEVPAAISSAVVRLCSSIRRRTEAAAS